MANHAHSTHTPLLPQIGAPLSLLPTELGRHPGPVTLAIRDLRPNEASSWEVRQAQIDAEGRAALRALHKRIEKPITPEVLGHVLAGAFIALVLSAPSKRLGSEEWLTDLANRLSELGSLAPENPAVAESLCAASQVLMQTELA